MLFGQFRNCRLIMIYCNCGLGTDDGTGGAASAIRVFCLSGEVAGLIGLLRDYDAVFGAYLHAQATALTALYIDNYFASHLSIYAVISFQFDSAGDSNS